MNSGNEVIGKNVQNSDNIPKGFAEDFRESVISDSSKQSCIMRESIDFTENFNYYHHRINSKKPTLKCNDEEDIISENNCSSCIIN